jgi:drug/metabolite transporter (DMT)-like permease
MLRLKLSRHPLFKPYLALAAVCFFWGTTYLGIRMALESFPPMLLVCVRYILSGSVLLGFARFRGLYLPKGKELAWACFSGLLTLGIGNGALVGAETRIASGIAGLIVTISPFWMVGVEALLPGGERLHLPTVGGMIVGLAGAALLFAPDAGSQSIDHNLVFGFLLLQFGMAGWSFGSIIQRRKAGKAHPVVAGGVQQLAAGLAMIPIAAASGDWTIHWSVRGVSAICYLITFGSLVGYSAYVYVMDRLPVSLVSLYPYVNVVVAVTLGWLFYREPFGRRELFAMIIIFVGVFIVKKYSHKPAPDVLPQSRRT